MYYGQLLGLVASFLIHTKGCEYGVLESCTFPCNCGAEFIECDNLEGTCDNGCPDGPPREQGFHWHGAGCRVGNVAYGKSCQLWNKANTTNRITDGNVSPQPEHLSCSPQIAAPGHTVWWTIDLKRKHRIFDVVVFNGVEGPLENLLVQMSNSSDVSKHAVSCGHIERLAGSGRANVSCHGPIVAQYVTLLHENKLSHHVKISLCETAIVGYIFRDCSRCLAGSPCDDFNGCRYCPSGYKRPDCTVCVMNTFGHDCLKTCHCKDGEPCSVVTGVCPNGCDNNYVGEESEVTCHIYTGDPSLRNLPLIVLNTTFTSVAIKWYRMFDVAVERFYRYTVYATVPNQFGFAPVNGSTRWQTELPNQAVISVLDGLLPNTTYKFQIQCFVDINVTTYGNKNIRRGDCYSQIVEATTDSFSNPLFAGTIMGNSLSLLLIILVIVLVTKKFCCKKTRHAHHYVMRSLQNICGRNDSQQEGDNWTIQNEPEDNIESTYLTVT